MSYRQIISDHPKLINTYCYLLCSYNDKPEVSIIIREINVNEEFFYEYYLTIQKLPFVFALKASFGEIPNTLTSMLIPSNLC